MVDSLKFFGVNLASNILCCSGFVQTWHFLYFNPHRGVNKLRFLMLVFAELQLTVW